MKQLAEYIKDKRISTCSGIRRPYFLSEVTTSAASRWSVLRLAHGLLFIVALERRQLRKGEYKR